MVVAATLLLRLPIFAQPFFNGDEATYSALARALLDGNLPYVGAVDHKPPLIYFTYATLLAVGGRFAIHWIHLVSILVVAGTGLLVGHLARRLGMGTTEARVATLAYLALTFIGPGKDMLAANAELFMMLPTTAAVVAYLAWRSRGSRGTWMAVLAGALAALAFLYKYQGGAVLGAMVLHEGLSSKAPVPRRLAGIAAMGLGFMATVASFPLGYLLAGHQEDLWFWAWRFPMTYAGKLPPTKVALNLALQTAKWAAPVAGYLWLAWRGLSSALRTPGGGPQEPWLVPWWLAWSALGAAAGGRFFLHYYIQLAPPLALTAAMGTRAVSETKGRLGSVLVALLLVPLVVSWACDIADPWLRPRIPAHTKVYAAVGGWIRAHTPGEARVFVWGNSPEIYHFSRRSMGTRFVFCNYQSGKIWGTEYDEEGAKGTEAQAIPETWAMLLDDLRSSPPEVIVDAASGGLDRWAGHGLSRYPRLWDIVSRAYERAATVEGVDIYLLAHRAEGVERPRVGGTDHG